MSILLDVPLLKLKIEEMFAFVATDEEGNEGVCAAFNPVTGGGMPLVGADMARVDSLRRVASEIAKRSNSTIRLVKFTNRVELEVIK